MQRVTSPKKYIEQLGQEYRRKYPAMPVAAAGLEASNRGFIDFISYPQKNEPRFVEWNFFRAEPGQRGIIVYEYTERKPFTKSALDAMKELNVKELRARMVSLLATNDFGVR